MGEAEQPVNTALILVLYKVIMANLATVVAVVKTAEVNLRAV